VNREFSRTALIELDPYSEPSFGRRLDYTLAKVFVQHLGSHGEKPSGIDDAWLLGNGLKMPFWSGGYF
jgi:hypothetical protein